MATDSQLIANRTNALASTGPVTAEGKYHVSRNAVTSGLFSATDFVLPDERDIYTEFCAAYEADLLPVGALEQTLAAEILHAGWRLRRCSTLETTGEHAQDSIDRARASAHRIFTRSVNELRKLQTEHQSRVKSDTGALGLASSLVLTQAQHAADKASVAAVEAELFGRRPERRCNSMEFHEEPAAGDFAKQSQSAPPEAVQTPRGAPCSCGSGIKFKRCCGKEAPPVLGRAA
jgi:SEC-C motif